MGWLAGLAVELLGDHAPWSADTHRNAVAYALSLDPEEAEPYLEMLGIESWADVGESIGLPRDPVEDDAEAPRRFACTRAPTGRRRAAAGPDAASAPSPSS